MSNWLFYGTSTAKAISANARCSHGLGKAMTRSDTLWGFGSQRSSLKKGTIVVKTSPSGK